jgi:hypothetical protein
VLLRECDSHKKQVSKNQKNSEMTKNDEIFGEFLQSEKDGGSLSYAQIQLVGKAMRQLKSTDSAYALVRLFPAYHPPTPENVQLLERFLADDAHDESRKGAVIGANYYWSLAGIDLTKIAHIASPEFSEIDDASTWFALSALGSAAVESSRARKLLVELAKRVLRFKFETKGCKKIYVTALRKTLHVAHAGHDAILVQYDPSQIPTIEESLAILASKDRGNKEDTSI